MPPNAETGGRAALRLFDKFIESGARRHDGRRAPKSVGRSPFHFPLPTFPVAFALVGTTFGVAAARSAGRCTNDVTGRIARTIIVGAVCLTITIVVHTVVTRQLGLFGGSALAVRIVCINQPVAIIIHRVGAILFDFVTVRFTAIFATDHRKSVGKRVIIDFHPTLGLDAFE